MIKMTDIKEDLELEEGQKEVQETLQERLEKLWKNKFAWGKGAKIKESPKPLTKGMELIMLNNDPDFLVLRSPLPGAPIDPETGRMLTIPVAVFGRHLGPENIEKVATEVGRGIQRGEVHYVPPEELEDENL